MFKIRGDEKCASFSFLLRWILCFSSPPIILFIRIKVIFYPISAFNEYQPVF